VWSLYYLLLEEWTSPGATDHLRQR